MRLSAFFAVLSVLSGTLALAQSPIERYRAAEKILKAHTPIDFLHDDSKEAVKALNAMWADSADATIDFLASNPNASPADLRQFLCKLEPEAYQCNHAGASTPDEVDTTNDVIQLSPGTLAISQFDGEVGTVFVLGPKNGKPALLWTISSALAQPTDKLGLIGAWRPERAGSLCRVTGTHFKPGQCGPLYASLGRLPPDAEGNPRFYIDAGYAQGMGATIGKQATVWRWNGNAAELLWEDWYDFMIDQSGDVSFENGILTFEQKDYFRTFFACGGCEERQELRRLRLMPSGVEDLGKVSKTPELDLIDELIWRIAKHRPTRMSPSRPWANS